VHCLVVVTVTVLNGIVFFFRNLSEFLLNFVTDQQVEVLTALSLRVEHVHQVTHLTRVKLSEERHELLEGLLVLLVLLKLGLGCVVQGLDHILEFLRFGVVGGQNIGVNKLLVVEFSDLFFSVLLEGAVGVPWNTEALFEKGPFGLALLGRWEFLALNHVEGQGKHLLAVGRCKLLPVDGSFVFVKGILELGHTLFVGLGNAFGNHDVVDGDLELDWVSLAGDDLLVAEVSNVLETVDFAKEPVVVISITSNTLDLVLVGVTCNG